MDFQNRRLSRCIWTSLVMVTLVLCFAFLCISFYTERRYGLRTPNSAPMISEKLTEEECISVCDTEECVQQSKILLGNVQGNVEPCDDFYQFACGGYIEKSDPNEVDLFKTRYVKVTRNKLRGILDNIDASPDSASWKLKTVYDSCVKFDSSEFQAVPVLLQVLNSLGIRGWPHLAPDYKFVEPSLAKVIANLLQYQEYAFVHFFLETIWIDEEDPIPNLTLQIADSPYEKKDQDLRKYELERILKYFSFDTETIEEFWKDSEAILRAIKNLRAESERIGDEDEETVTTCGSCMNCVTDPEGEWKDMCESLKSLIHSSGWDEKFNENFANFYDVDEYFMKNVFPVLRNFSDRSIANYLVLNVILNNLNDLNFYFRLLYQNDPNAHNHILSFHEPISHWEHCVQWIMSHMGFALGYEFVKNDIATASLLEVQNITKELIQETKETVSRQKWMSDTLLGAIVEKIENIQDTGVLFLDAASNETFINQMYEEFQASERSFLQNVFEYKRFENAKGIGCFSGNDIVPCAALLFMPEASSGEGDLTLYPGILLPATFMPGLQKLINLVSLGKIIVHEIGHNMQSFLEVLARSELEDIDYYRENLLCLEKQFSTFRLESIGKNLVASKYSRENVADNIVVPIIDKLIEEYVANGELISLPGLPYTTKQLLYISSAQTWCSIYTYQEEKKSYESDTHSHPMFRLQAMMQNSEEFSESFGCPEGSYMNPSVKCLLLKI